MKFEYISEVNKEAFEKLKNSINKNTKNPGKKFNIKIKSEDLSIIDYISEKQNLTRSSILNKVIDDILKDEIDSIEDYDAKLLVAKAADEHYETNSDEPGRWTCWVLRHHIRELQENYLQWNSPQPVIDAPTDIQSTNSEQFNFFKKRIY